MEKKEQLVDGVKKIYLRPNGTKRVQTINSEPSKTQAHHQDLTNPNAIVRKYGYRRLQMPPPDAFRDLSELPDLLEAQRTIVKANESFNSLPSQVRTKFHNDPNELINFLNSTDERDIEDSIKLGLRNPKPEPPPEDPQLTAMKEIAANTRKPKQKNSDD